MDVRVHPKTFSLAVTPVVVLASWFPLLSRDSQSLDSLRIFRERTLHLAGFLSGTRLFCSTDSQRSAFLSTNGVQHRGWYIFCRFGPDRPTPSRHPRSQPYKPNHWPG